MKKVGFLAVSLAALMSVGAARADIASTTYVDNIADTKQDKLTIDTLSSYDTKHTDNDSRIPTVKVAEEIAGATADAAITATVTQIGNTYATKTELTTETNARTSADTALGTRIDNEVSARTSGDNAINTKIGTVPTGKTVVGMIEEAQEAATYDDMTVKADIKKNADAITTINNSAVMTSGATKAKIDAIATNTDDITAIKTEQGTQNTKISALESGKQDNLGYTAEDAAHKTITISAVATASDTKYPSEKAVATALAGKQAAGDYATNTTVNGVKATAEAANTLANTNKTAIEGLQTSKQDKLTTSNIKGTGSVTVTVADGVVTVDGTDTQYTLPAATANALGGVKSGGNITVAADGAVTVNQAASATNATNAMNATKATQDAAGNVITETYATKTENDAKLATSTYDSQIGTVSAANMGTTATTVVGGIKEAVTEAAAAQSTADTAKTNAATAQARADSAYTLANAAIPKPSGDCTDCVLKFNGTAFSWEEIGR